MVSVAVQAVLTVTAAPWVGTVGSSSGGASAVGNVPVVVASGTRLHDAHLTVCKACAHCSPSCSLVAPLAF